MRGPRLQYLRESARAIAHHMAGGCQAVLGPLGHFCIGEVGHGRQAHVQRMSVLAGLHRRNESALVGRLAPAVDMPLAAPGSGRAVKHAETGGQTDSRAASHPTPVGAVGADDPDGHFPSED